MKSVKYVLGLVTTASVSGTHAFAHVRWFAEDQGPHADQQYSMDTAAILIVAGALLFVALALAIEYSGACQRLDRRLRESGFISERLCWRIVAVLTGLMLLVNAYQGIYLAPNLTLPGAGFETMGAVAQAAVGMLLCAQISFSFSGLLVLIVTCLTVFLVPFEVLIDYLFEFVALSLSLILVGPSLNSIDRRFFPCIREDSERFARLALPVIRIGVGLTLVILAVHNKLLNPGLGLAFLDEFHFNFMPRLGFEGFTDLRFVFSAGVGELTLGLLILGGVATRFVTVVLTAFFTATLIALGPMELIGHAPLIGIAVLLMFRGAGPYRITRTGHLPARASDLVGPS